MRALYAFGGEPAPFAGASRGMFFQEFPKNAFINSILALQADWINR